MDIQGLERLKGVNFDLTRATERKILKELGWVQGENYATCWPKRTWTKTIDGYHNQLLLIQSTLTGRDGDKNYAWLHGRYDGGVNVEPNLIAAIAAAETYHVQYPTVFTPRLEND